jgi:hypothetical protein
MNNEVFCFDCKYLKNHTIENCVHTDYCCIHADNIIVCIEHNWLKTSKIRKCKNQPRDINQNNDCKWFESKKQGEKL